MFLNGNLQFSSTDEYRYHEALVHPAMLVANNPQRVLVLGGGDGLALREMLKYPSVEHVTLVDLDPDMTRLSNRFPLLAELNQQSFDDKRVHVINDDALIWLEQTTRARCTTLRSSTFPIRTRSRSASSTRRASIACCESRLTQSAPVIVQATSPLFARNSYWCIIARSKQRASS